MALLKLPGVVGLVSGVHVAVGGWTPQAQRQPWSLGAVASAAGRSPQLLFQALLQSPVPPTLSAGCWGVYFPGQAPEGENPIGAGEHPRPGRSSLSHLAAAQILGFLLGACTPWCTRRPSPSLRGAYGAGG